MTKDGTMRRGKSYAVIAVTVVALALGLAACGGGEVADDAGVAGTAAERAVEILGAEPTGVAKEIVDRGYVIVANDADYAPESSIDEATGELVGFDVDVAKGMGEALGLEVRFENPAWETIPAGLNQGRYDVSIGSMPITPERDELVDFSQPYYFTPGQVFVNAGGPQVGGVTDLAGTTVGVAAATTFYDYLKEDSEAQVRTYATDADAFADLRKGKLDFVMSASQTGQRAILQGEPFAFSGTPLYYEDLAFAAAEGETDWVALLDFAIAQMHENGSLTEMSKTWYDGLDLTLRQ